MVMVVVVVCLTCLAAGLLDILLKGREGLLSIAQISRLKSLPQGRESLFDRVGVLRSSLSALREGRVILLRLTQIAGLQGLPQLLKFRADGLSLVLVTQVIGLEKN